MIYIIHTVTTKQKPMADTQNITRALAGVAQWIECQPAN